MPIVKIEVTRQRSPEEITAIIDAVYHAQLVAFKLPEEDKQIRYVQHERHCFPIPPGKTDNYTIVEFNVFPGRSIEAKRRLYAEVTARLCALGIQPADLIIVLHEPPMDNWGLRGLPASEVNIGFNIDV